MTSTDLSNLLAWTATINAKEHGLEITSSYAGLTAANYTASSYEPEFVTRTFSIMIRNPGYSFTNDVYPKLNEAGLVLESSTLAAIDETMYLHGLNRRVAS
jgi:hypothetical protein